MTEKTTPAEVYPLAEFICDEMAARGWTAGDVVRRMKANPSFVDYCAFDMFLVIHRENLILDEELFTGLSQAFGVSARFFRAIHDTWLAHPKARVAFVPPEDLLSGYGEWGAA